MEPKHRLQKARESAGYSGPSEAARALKLNLNTLTSHENGNRAISRKAAERYAEAFGVSAGWLLYGEDRDTFTPEIIPGIELLANDTMPVYAAARGGSGHVIVTFDEVDRVKRPAVLQNVRGGYGLLTTGDSMVPAFFEGDIALVHPHKPPQRDKHVVLYHTPPMGGEAEAMIKTLVSWNDREWTLRQYNPAKEFKEFVQEWPVCHRVVGKYDG